MIKLNSLHISIIILLLLNSIVWSQANNNIRINQLGFYTKGPKAAVVIGSSATSFSIKSPDRLTTYFTGALSGSKYWAQSGENAKIADFTLFQRSGKYVVDIPELGYSYEFHVSNDVYDGLNHSLIKAYYYNRASTALSSKTASVYARTLGHTDDQVVILPSAASPGRPAGTIVSSPKGWYDAGDYNCYIVNSGISTYEMLISYEHFKNYYKDLDLNILESNNNLPDLLDEIKWNLDWMLTMQDPLDGGVYNKKTNANFDAYVMPSAANNIRYMEAKGTAAAFDFAAVMATAYRIYKDYNLIYANQCLEASKKAYTWGINNPNIEFNNSNQSGIFPAIVTGGYGDNNFSDEREWASNELYIATKTNAYYNNGFKESNVYGLPSWSAVRTLGLMSLVFHRKSLGNLGLSDTTAMNNKLSGLANTYVNYQKSSSPYGIAQGQGGNFDFPWGSNSVCGNQGVVLVNAFLMSGRIDYLNAAMANLDYLLGRNALGYSFISGFGTRKPTIIHHRPSLADGISAIQPGWVVGGPTGPQEDGCAANSEFLAKSWVDQDCYSKTEVTINWNSPAVYLTSFMGFYGKKEPQKPFSNAISIPGVLEAENFDNGGQGISYYDVEGANLTGISYRSEGVDVANLDANNFAVGYIEDGEWLEYSTNVSTDGNYLFTFREASLLGGGVVKILVDGLLSGAVNMTSSGSWNTFKDINISLFLPKGNHIIRLLFDKGSFNFDKVTTSFISAVGVNEDLEDALFAYPNPTEGKVFLNVDSDWTLTSLEGYILRKGFGKEINLSSYPNGVYVVQTLGKTPLKIQILR